MIVNQASRFSVPAFILISGMGLSIGYKKNQSYFTFIGRRLSKILPQYIIWCIIYIFFTNENINIYSDISNIVYGKVFYHFYYIPLIIEFYLIFPFIYRIIWNKWFALLSFVITTTILFYTHYYILTPDMQWFLERKNFLDWIFYFSFGAFIGKNFDVFSAKVKKYKGLVFVLFFISIYSMINEVTANIYSGRDIEYITTFLRPNVLIYSIALIVLIFVFNWEQGIFIEIIKFISKNSYDIYLSHALILYYYTQYCVKNSISINSLNFGIKSFVITLFGSLLINKIKKLL